MSPPAVFSWLSGTRREKAWPSGIPGTPISDA